MEIEGKRIVVTGASRGIGYSLTRQLCAAGAEVLAVARDEAALDALNGPVIPLPCDLGDRQARGALLEKLTGDLAPVDVLINNAAIQVEAHYPDDLPDAAGDIARELAINLEAPVHLSAVLMPHLARRPEAAIINITSALAFAPKAAAPVYCATKAGLQRFTTALRYQTDRSCPNVRVSEVIMPMVDTGMTAGRGHGKIAPDIAAASIVEALCRGRDRVLVGKTRAFAAIHRVSPALAARIVRG